MSKYVRMEIRHEQILSRCLSIDLEVNPGEAKVFAIAAVHHDDRPALKCAGRPTEQFLDALEAQIGDVAHPIGHNFLSHDLEHLVAARPRLGRIMTAPIDTLWLNPLAFPRNPYHHLVKHYHDGRLATGHVNDPELDARLVFEVLANQLDALGKLGSDAPDALTAYHYLTTRMENAGGFDAVFGYLRGKDSPGFDEASAAVSRMLEGRACEKRIEQTLGRLSSPRNGWPMAYALSWITVAGGDSVMPPWVRAQFREASLIVRHLRDTSCKDPGCAWCAEQNDPVRALEKWFGFPAFRPQPVDPDGRPLQERIVDEAMSGNSVLGILPTGTGKSLCYQVPALSRFDKIGALTVVISPLVALMADQVQGMERSGISCSVTINGMMSMPERQSALDKVRLGDAGILIISPEQLRSTSIRNVLAQREVGLWAIDEAHCVSKWGHDFRPDYRYLGRFIKEFSGDQAPAPVICLTATAKPEVVADIVEHFQSRAGIKLLPLDGGASRTNLAFDVRPTTRNSKLTDVLSVIEEFLPSEGRSGAVVYCASRKETERVAEFLKSQGLDAEHFHAGLGADDKQAVQERFRVGELRVIAATNAFGMGIDKPDIRLVVHADIPGSLENYLQEAGRAGRDREDAHCVLLFAADDVERQFRLSASSRLARHEIGAILKALRRIDERTKKTGKVVATTGEIMRSEKDQEFERDSATDDTRVKTAVSWLEDPRAPARRLRPVGQCVDRPDRRGRPEISSNPEPRRVDRSRLDRPRARPRRHSMALDTTPAATALETRSLKKAYGAVEILHDINIEMAQGEFLVLVGPSGCGKSTLLNCIAGLEEITSGTLTIGGRDVTNEPPKDRDIAMVFQSYALYPTMSVGENIGFGMKIRRVPKAQARDKITEVAKLLQIDHLLDRRPSQLSGGQRQRVAMGRALVRDPKLFLFDEPLSNLDAALRVQMRIEIARMHHDFNATMIYVTHDQVEAMTMADKIVVLRAGRIEQVGTPLDLYNKPRNQFVAGFIGSPRMNFVPATQLPQAQAGAVTVGIRPEHAQLADDGQLQLQVTQVEQLGANSILHGHVVPDAPFEVILPGQTRIQRGDTVRVTAPAENLHYFDKDGLRI